MLYNIISYLDIQLCKLIKLPALCTLLFSLFSIIPSNEFWDSVMKSCSEKCLNHLKQSPKKFLVILHQI